MLDKKNLSKIKYIYRIYSADNMLHLERYPVVYINSEVVYYKEARKNAWLGHRRIDEVKDGYDIINKPTRYWTYTIPWVDSFYWGLEVNIYEVFEDLKKQYDVIAKERAAYLNRSEKDKKRERLEKAKAEYEAALREIELLDSLNNDKE